IESRSSPGRNNPVTGPYLGSVRGGAADVRDERAANARPARALEKLLVPAPHDADRPPEEVLDRARAEEARVAALVAIVAHEENLALRHRDRAERAERGTVWQDANEVRPSAENLRAEENRLAIVVLLLRKEVDRLDLPVHIERLVPELDDVAREPDEALDERHASAVGVADDDDVSPSGRAGLEEADLREGNPELVSGLPDEDAVALEDRGLHGAGRNDVPVGQNGPSGQDDGGHQNELADVFEEGSALFRREGHDDMDLRTKRAASIRRVILGAWPATRTDMRPRGCAMRCRSSKPGPLSTPPITRSSSRSPSSRRSARRRAFPTSPP